MEKYHGNTVEYWKQNAEENYLTTPISVLKYITVLEEQAEQLRQTLVMESVCSCSKGKGIDHDEDGKAYCIDCGNYLEQTVP